MQRIPLSAAWCRLDDIGYRPETVNAMCPSAWVMSGPMAM
jgi:hypothetical protein